MHHAPAALDQPPLLYTEQIRIHARLQGARPAAICDGQALSWGDFHRQTNQVAHALRAEGLQHGDRVCLVMNSSLDMFVLIWGVIKSGGVVVPLNVMMAGDSLGLAIEDCDPRWIFADAETAPAVQALRPTLPRIRDASCLLAGSDSPLPEGWRALGPWRDAQPETEVAVSLQHSDSMNIIYSSGSTGKPKGIEHSHFARHIYSLGFGPGLEMNRWSVPICSTPLYTNGTWITMLPAVYWGGTTVLMRRFSAAEFFAAIERHRCTHMFMVPTQYIVLIESGLARQHDLSSVRVCLSGGQATADKTWEGLRSVFPGARLFECYGITEGFITLASPEDKALPGKRRSVGLPMFGGELLILDEEGRVQPPHTVGDITGYGPALMKGYFRQPEATARMTWKDAAGRTFLRSGDLGYLDEDGYLFIAGRIKDMIKSGGINVYASDIEEVFMRHPEVQEVAAIGIPHEKWIETPLLLAILREGATVTAEELKAWGNAQLGRWQKVHAVEFRTEFPRATHDKVLKRALREPYWAPRS